MNKLSAEKIEYLLDKELSKPENEIDFVLVDKLTSALIKAKDGVFELSDVNEKRREFEKKYLNKSKKKYIQSIVTVVTVCMILAFGNFYSVYAWDKNIFSLVIELTKDGAKIDFGDKAEISLSVSDNDKYGIKTVCNQNGVYIETPSYIPDGFILTKLECENGEERKLTAFVYKNDNQIISLTFESYFEGVAGIPSDKHNLSEITICGKPAVVSKEDEQMIAVFRSGDFFATIGTKNVPYSECDKILNSIS